VLGWFLFSFFFFCPYLFGCGMDGLAGGGLVASNYCILSVFYYRIEMGMAFDSSHGKEGQLATIRTVPANRTRTGPEPPVRMPHTTQPHQREFRPRK
jgi:hypothetical protein